MSLINLEKPSGIPVVKTIFLNIKYNKMIAYRDELARILYCFLKSSSFSRLRFYVVDKVKNEAVLYCAIDMEHGPKNRAEEYPEMFRIPLNIKKLYKGSEANNTSFVDFVVRFSEKSAFCLPLKNLNDIPDGVANFHDRYNIDQLGLMPVWGDGKNFIGYLAVDKSLENDKEIKSHDLKMLQEYADLMNKTLIESLYNIEAEGQRDILLNKSEELMKMLDDKTYGLDGIMIYLMESIFSICNEVDIIQIKQIMDGGKKYKCLYLEVNPNSDITIEERSALGLLNGGEFDLDSSKDWVTDSVYRTQSAMLILDTRDFANDKLADEVNGGTSNNPKKIILKRCLSEANVPFRFGGGLFGIIDVHGRWPYALNKNTISVLRDIAPWISIILNEKKYNISYDFSEMQKVLGNYIEKRGSDVEEAGQKNMITFNSCSFYDSRDVYNFINYENNKKFVVEYKRFVDGEFVYKFTRRAAIFGLMLGLVIMPITFMSGISIIYPFLSILFVFACLVFWRMSIVGMGKYSEISSDALMEIKNIIEESSNEFK